MAAPAKVLELIERFENNREAYKSGHYNETQIRREFIDPLFKALGWDIDNHILLSPRRQRNTSRFAGTNSSLLLPFILMTLHKRKYQNAVLYLCKELEGEVRGKKKLAKLLYFVDFDYYEKYQKSITGDMYKALPMGPVPSALAEITDEMMRKKMLSIRQVQERPDFHPTEVFRCIVSPDLSVFTADEKQMLARIVRRYGHLTGKQLQDLTHAEAPYASSKPNQEVSYEFSYYRGTDFSDL
ncbi:MAG: type II toxin-antitoxin system antitoxin SocA domain-containing protein [Candidatus Peregrinibacteria bacterium]